MREPFEGSRNCELAQSWRRVGKDGRRCPPTTSILVNERATWKLEMHK